MIRSLGLVPHGPTGAIVSCFGDKIRASTGYGGLTWNFRALVSGMKQEKNLCF